MPSGDLDLLWDPVCLSQRAQTMSADGRVDGRGTFWPFVWCFQLLCDIALMRLMAEPDTLPDPFKGHHRAHFLCSQCLPLHLTAGSRSFLPVDGLSDPSSSHFPPHPQTLYTSAAFESKLRLSFGPSIKSKAVMLKAQQTHLLAAGSKLMSCTALWKNYRAQQGAHRRIHGSYQALKSLRGLNIPGAHWGLRAVLIILEFQEDVESTRASDIQSVLSLREILALLVLLDHFLESKS